MSDKLALWDKLGKTDPKHTKQFSRAGGFKGTAIKPIWSYRRMTEEFGPCGEGWGINQPSFQVVNAGDDVLVYCTVSVWHQNRDNVVFGVGGDKVSSKNKNGVFTDDEAFKKAFTDAVTNALKLIGVGADVHMGLFDDQKYVNSMRDEFAQDEEAAAETPVQDEQQLKNAEKADKVVRRGLEIFSPMRAEDIAAWHMDPNNGKAIEAFRWVKDNFPEKWAEIQGLGYDLFDEQEDA